ncbi:MAG: hypothetical protein BGO55_28425 [Sphingobacteriales bacterium 50-39]|nr:hypothetical protein [Sphingobacteriales bacterium]OJW60492.1 MAG: hypothetical protein BGO55_28425 [Sphingobacteriales bacterium 50-39]
MNLEQAQKLRKKLLYLEGLIAWNSREYIWRVVIGPQDQLLMERFRELVDPAVPFNPRTILQPFRREELTVYFFLKIKGNLICREFKEFLTVNELEIPKAGYVLSPFPL